MHDDNNNPSLLPILAAATSTQLAAASHAASEAVANNVFNDYCARIADATMPLRYAQAQRHRERGRYTRVSSGAINRLCSSC